MDRQMPNQLYSALVFQGGAAWRKRLLIDIGDQHEARSDDELARRYQSAGTISRRC
jgi:pyruvate dehydrogenase E1 component